MTSQTGKKTVTIYVMPDISWGKDNKIKLGQLIDNMRNIVLENHAQNAVGKLVPHPFLRKSKLSISLNQQPEISYGLFNWMSTSRTTKKYWN